MQTYISLLRGINVSGQKKIRMADLKSLYQSLGLENVQTYVQSGNVVFNSLEKDPYKLAKSLETQIETAYGFSVPVLVFSWEDLQHLIENRYFAQERGADPSRVLVTFLYERPDPAKLENLSAPKIDPCQFVLGEREIFLYCPDGYGRSKLSNNFFEKKLEVTATTRNWKTVQTLYQMASER